MKFEKAFVGGTIVEVAASSETSCPTLCSPALFPSRLLQARFTITIFAFYALQYLNILPVFEFYFTVRGFSLCLCWLSLGVPGAEVLCVCILGMEPASVEEKGSCTVSSAVVLNGGMARRVSPFPHGYGHCFFWCSHHLLP